MHIGEHIRSARKAAKLSQEGLARRANVSMNVVSRLERGEITDPHYSTLSRIAGGLGVSVEGLLEETDAPKAPALTSPIPAEEADEERREREELAVALLHEGTKRAEVVEEKLKAMSDEMPVTTIMPLVELHLALRSLYEEIASTRQPSAELQEAYESFETAVSRVSRQVTQMMHPGTREAYTTRKLFAERRAERLRGAQEERDERAGGRGAG